MSDFMNRYKASKKIFSSNNNTSNGKFNPMAPASKSTKVKLYTYHVGSKATSLFRR